MASHWLAHRVLPLKKQVHPGWEYSGLQDSTRETSEKITLKILVKHLEEIFQDTYSWPTDEQVRSYHIGLERDPVRHLCLYQYYYLLETLYLVCLNARFGYLYLSCPQLQW
jgi:Ni,Fe-hydrogenase III component G